MEEHDVEEIPWLQFIIYTNLWWYKSLLITRTAVLILKTAWAGGAEMIAISTLFQKTVKCTQTQTQRTCMCMGRIAFFWVVVRLCLKSSTIAILTEPKGVASCIQQLSVWDKHHAEVELTFLVLPSCPLECRFMKYIVCPLAFVYTECALLGGVNQLQSL